MDQRESTARGTASAPLTRVILFVMLGVAVVAFAARVVPMPRTIDDAFITFRYSRNLVAGEGFVYNPGTRTLGTTTPLYTLLMAGISLVTGSEQYPWFALFVNALADAWTAALLAYLAYRMTARCTLSVVIGMIWAFNPESVTFAVGGMETSVSILWAVAAVVAYVERYDRWMAVFAALAILTRVDTLLWIGLIFLHQAFTHWRATAPAATGRAAGWLARIPWQTWVVFGVLLLPWYAFSLAYFGTLMSNSLHAKQVAYMVEPVQALSRFLQQVATPFSEHDTFGPLGVMVGVIAYPALAGVGIYYTVRRGSRLAPYAVYPVVYIAAFSVMNPLIFRWYVVPILPAYVLAVLLGLWALSDTLFARASQRVLVNVMVVAFGALFVFTTLNAWRWHPTHGPDRPAPKMAWHKIELEYRDVGLMLREDYGVNADTLVAAGDIGALGYYSHARILDTVGLVTPELLAYYPVPDSFWQPDANYAVPPGILLDYEPAFFVIMRGYIRGGLENDPAFNAQYVPVKQIATDYYGGAMIVFQRRHLSGADLERG